MRIFASLFLLAAVLGVAVAGVCLAGCVRSGATPPPADPETELDPRQAACVAAATNLVIAAELSGQPCATTLEQLRELAETDENCKAFFGDAPVFVDPASLCQIAPE